MPKIHHPNTDPYSGIGILKMRFPDGSGFGSGALIDKQHILTCAHNVWTKNKQAPESVQFTRAHSSADAPADGSPISKVFVPQPFLEKRDRSWDIAVLRLKAPVTEGYIFGREIIAEADQAHGEVTITGYPSTTRFWMTEEANIVAGANVPDHVMAYIHDTAPGSSGSPVYRGSHKAGYRILGVHSGLSNSSEEDKVGVMLTEITNGFIAWAISQPDGALGDGLVVPVPVLDQPLEV